ncbi:MAG: hypothetical protein GXW99_09360 [Clostridiales bacterium]|nr:hypothetical protein [Clostridiales bacterium]
MKKRTLRLLSAVLILCLIAMKLPDEYLRMKNIDLCTGLEGQDIYSRGHFSYSLSNSNFSIDGNNVITVTPTEGTRYMNSDLTITWISDTLAFSAYGISVTVPLVWTNYTTSELNEKFTASVKVGNLTDGYETVWSNRYGRIDEFDLPTKEKILNLIRYDSYNNGTENLKYSAVGGYTSSQTTGLQITGDTEYIFEVTPRTYTLTVTGVQNKDGSTTTKTFTTGYGEAFNLDALAETRTDNPELTDQPYTSFLNLSAADGDNFLTDTKVDLNFINKYGTSPTLTANYNDDTRRATYSFTGITAPDKTVLFKKGTKPDASAWLLSYIREFGGEDAELAGVSPDELPTNSSITYVVSCRVAAGIPTHTVTFNVNGGNELQAQIYHEGSLVIQPTAVKPGYTFKGWYKDQSLSTAFEKQEKMGEEDMTLYAKWEASTYQVTLYTGNTETIEPVNVTYNTAYTLPSPAMETRKFLGWYTEESGGDAYASTGTFTNTTNLMLYAHWGAKAIITLSFTPNKTDQQPQTHTYNETPWTFAFSTNPEVAPDSFVVEYSKQGSDNWTTAAPTDAGTYDVKISRPADNDYNAVAEQFTSAAIKIEKANLELTNFKAYTKGNVVVFQRPDGIKGGGIVTYYLNGNSSTDPKMSGVKAGQYTPKVSVSKSANYLSAELSAPAIKVTGLKSGWAGVEFTIHTADVETAGTDSTVYGQIVLPDGSFLPSAEIIEGDRANYLNKQIPSPGNAFERNATETYEIVKNIVPWQVSKLRIHKLGDYESSGGDWKVDWIKVNVQEKEAHIEEHRIPNSLDDEMQWLTGNEAYVGELTSFNRAITAVYNFYSLKVDDATIPTENTTIDLSASNTAYSYTYSGKITDQYDTYDAFSYYDPPAFSVKASDSVYDQFIHFTGVTDFTIDTEGLAAYMKENNKTEQFTYKVQMTLPDRSTTSAQTITHENKTINALGFRFEKIISVKAPAASPAASRAAFRSVLRAPAAGAVQETSVQTASVQTMGFKATGAAAPVAHKLAATQPLSTQKFAVSVGKAAAKRGQVIELPVCLDQNPNLWGVWANVDYDHSAFELLSCSAGEIFAANEFTMRSDLTKAPFSFLATRKTLDNTSVNGVLVLLKFMVKPDAAEQTYEITASPQQAIDAAGALQTAAVEKGSLEVKGIQPGGDTGGTDNRGNTNDTGKNTTGSQTGDNSLVPWIILLLASSGMLTMVVVTKKRRKESNK